jgi:hypothetical protein
MHTQLIQLITLCLLFSSLHADMQLLKEIYERHKHQGDDEPIKEAIRVFTLTIQPSMINLHCDKNDYFKVGTSTVGVSP